MSASAEPENDEDKKRLKKKGIESFHTYAITDAFEIFLDNGTEEKLLKLRNPQGSYEWVGDWSDESPQWTPALRECLGLKNRDDGVFFMNYRDFCRYFSEVEICHIYDQF